MDIEVSETAGVRYLHFGSDWIQGAMRIARPWALELDYTREMMAGLILREQPTWPRNALLVGLGAGSLTKFLYRHRPQCRLLVVEIAPQVVAVAQQHFRLPGEDARLHIEIADGAQYMMRKSPRFDLILVDGFDADALAGDLDTLSFYLNCRQRLSSQGLLVTNLLSRRRNFRDSVARIKTAFDDRAIAFPSCDSGNAIAVAATGATIDRTLAELEEAAATLKTTTGLKLAPTLSRLAASGVFRGARLQL